MWSYNCVWYVLCCCLHGVIKHDDDDDKGSRHFASVSTTLYCRPTSRYTNISPASHFYYRPTTLCIKKVPTFQLSVTLSNVKRFSKFLHCLKAYEICYKPYDITLLTLGVLLQYLGKLKMQIICRYSAQ